MKQILLIIVSLQGLLAYGLVLPPLDPCETPLLRPGVCISVKHCPPVLYILNHAKRPLVNQLRQHLQKYQCGYELGEPKVCCDFSIILPTTTRATTSSTTARSTSRLRLTNLAGYNLQQQINNLAKLDAPPEDVQQVVQQDDLQHIVHFQDDSEESVTKNNRRKQDAMFHRNINLLPLDNCGMGSSNKIANGNETELFQYPWMARLIYNSSFGPLFKCGGSLISNRYVLTAAHCILKNLTMVRLGEYNTTTDIDCHVDPYFNETVCADKFIDVEIESITSHSDYNSPIHANDIALLRLKQTVDFTKSIQPICLPVSAEQQKAKLKKMIVMGWGRTEYGTNSEVLLEAFVDFVPQDLCQNRYNERQSYTKLELSPTQLCAIGAPGVDSCRGDSGGPLVNYGYYNTSDLRMIEVGIVSAGVPGCGHNNSTPGIYTQVSSYIQWILNELKP